MVHNLQQKIPLTALDASSNLETVNSPNLIMLPSEAIVVKSFEVHCLRIISTSIYSTSWRTVPE